MSQELLAGLLLVSTIAVVVAMFLVLWHQRTTPRTARIAVVSGIVLAVWAGLTVWLASRGFYLPTDRHQLAPVVIQLVIALVALSVLLAISPSLRSLLTNQKNLLRLNLWRLLGVVFVALMFSGQMPALWALPAGLGDIAIGLAAIPVVNRLDRPGGGRRAILFNWLGLADLVTAVGLGALAGPGPVQLFHPVPTTELVSHFPLALVPGFLVPLAVMLHIVSLWQLYGFRWAGKDFEPSSQLQRSKGEFSNAYTGSRL